MLEKLKPNTSYTHAWEYFSKLFLLWKDLDNTQNILHIVSSKKDQSKYQIIAKQLGINYFLLESYHDLNHLNTQNSSIYSITVEVISIDISQKIIDNWFILKKGDEIEMETLMKQLLDLGYEFSEYEKPKSYQRLWDQIKIFFPNLDAVTISFWWDEIESLSKNNKELSRVSLHSLWELSSSDRNAFPLLDYLKKENVFCMLDSIEFHHSYEKLISLHASSYNILKDENFSRQHDLEITLPQISELEDLKSTLWDRNSQIQIYSRHSEMIERFLSENNFGHIKLHSVTTHILASFGYPEKNWKQSVVICDDILGKIFIKKRVKKKLSADIDLLLKIQNGDYVVHIDHGIWVFKSIVKKQLGQISKEYMEISYKENDKLFVPITEVNRVTKYVWSENPQLTPLSWKVWEKKIKKVHEDIREIAEELLKNFAERKLRSSGVLEVDRKKTSEFQESFPYPYTLDQIDAVEDIYKDMWSDRNMDRLLVWDVGFGKTEVAFNAMLVALENKKQVLFISPLVVLAHEHFIKTQSRFKALWYKVEVLTRLQSQKHATMVLKWVADGSIDMVVGTHRLLSDKLTCKNLGLMVVDEEHKFWVSDKEKIKNIKTDIDILSLSATPIPRSLNLALSGVRSISLLKTPPTGRKSIDTSVLQFNEALIKNAWEREFQRGGQIFFVHNRVNNIEVFKKKLESLFPKKKVIITHWQLAWDELENRILDFKNKKYDILLSTTVIENWIDFSNVNTIFINECQQFWISQIHQLRGRVWRSDAQWYCYLLYRKDHLDGEAAKRIQTIVDYSYLWAWFELAMKDLEIRGGGDILWVRQSGQAKEIWVSLFLKMLEEKIEDLKQEKNNIATSQEDKWLEEKKNINIQTKIDLMISASIPDDYFLSETDKLNFYREIELVSNISDLEHIKTSFLENSNNIDITNETLNLFSLLEVQIACRKYKIISIKKVGINYQLDFHVDTNLDELKQFLALDRDVLFSVVDAKKLRCKTKGFASDIKFIEYLLQLLWGNVQNKKIRLIKKA
jgi:transcription-repair coupling factor